MVHPPTTSEWSSVVFFVNDDSPLPGERDEIIKSLLSRGAQSCPPAPVDPAQETSSSNRFDVEKVTVVVSSTLNFPEYPDIERWNRERVRLGNGEERKERKWVVTTEWLTRMEKCDKWQHPQYFSADPKYYFSGVCVCVSDEMSTGDRDAIYAAVLAFGGQTKTVLTTEVTHLLCPTAKGVMYKTGIDHVSSSFHVVLPHWFDKCVAVGLLADTRPFAWPNPPLLATSGNPHDNIPTDVPTPIKSILGTNKQAELTTPQQPNYASNEVLKGRKVVFSKTLEMESSRLEGIKAMVRRSGGEVAEGGREEKLVGEDGEGDVLITKHRAGRAYYAAVRARKTIATVAWLYHICMVDHWADPKNHLLHYPVPEQSIPEFEKYQMTVTNYTGDTREYIKRLIDLMGGQFTADMGKANTHVIAASEWGPKVAKARSKNKVLVNHHWVEACFVNWKVVEPTLDRLYAVDAHGLSAQSLVAKKGLLDSDLGRWTDPAWDQPEEEEAEAMEVEEDLIPSNGEGIVLTGASGKERGDVEMALDEEEAQEEEDEQAAEREEDVQMPAPAAEAVDDALRRNKLSASQSKSSSSVLPAVDKLKAPLRASSSATAMSSSKPPSATVTGPPSSRTEPIVDEPAHEPSSTPQSDNGEPPAPVAAPRSKPILNNAHASSSKSASVAVTKAAATPAYAPNPSTPRANSAQPRGLSPSSILPPRSRRKAADSAELKLHAAMEDRNEYEKAKRNGTLMSDPNRRRKSAGADGARSSSPVRPEKKQKIVEKQDESESESESEDEKAGEPTPKGKGAANKKVKKEVDEDAAGASSTKPTKGKNAPVKTTVWLMTTKVELNDKKITALESLGAKITSDMARCTHLLASEISRTPKFLNALIVGATILSEKWVAASLKAGRLLEGEHLLVDSKNEKKFGLSLAVVVDRAAKHRDRGGLLAGKSFWWTPKVMGDLDQIKKLVESAGGTITKGFPKASLITESRDSRFLISDVADIDKWRPLEDKGVKVYDRELILSALLHQKFDPSSKYLVKHP